MQVNLEKRECGQSENREHNMQLEVVGMYYMVLEIVASLLLMPLLIQLSSRKYIIAPYEVLVVFAVAVLLFMFITGVCWYCVVKRRSKKWK